jgi:hypothetical protein
LQSGQNIGGSLVRTRFRGGTTFGLGSLKPCSGSRPRDSRAQPCVARRVPSTIEFCAIALSRCGEVLDQAPRDSLTRAVRIDEQVLNLQHSGPEGESCYESQDRAVGCHRDSQVHAYSLAVSYTKDPRVDAYLDGLPQWQRAICQRVRDLVHAADSEVQETIKRRVRPYFVLDGNICALLATKDHVNVFLYDGGIVPDPERIITGGHENKTARTVAIHQDEAINEPALATMFRQIVANNRAGGWRKLKSGRADG